ncbi:MAG: SOS response-associated peptidase [Saprospiraceae bacterium]|nr:SOS response-associated peptidase [Candidatus Opimibacter skivensis]
MCGRSSLTKTEKELEERFRATFYSDDLERYNPLPNFNVAPTHMHPVITQEEPRVIHLYRWGLIPSWAKDTKIGSKLINARIEGIEEKPSFRSAFQKRRCIVPFDGYYEWQKTPEGKIPYRIQLRDTEIFTIAGLYEHWKDPKGGIIHSFTLITHGADASISHLHDRQPMVLLPEQEALWLDANIPTKDLIHELGHIPGSHFTWYRVSDRVNKVSENDAGLIEAV